MAEIRALSNAVNSSNPVKSKPETWIVEQDSITIKLNIKEVTIIIFSSWYPFRFLILNCKYKLKLNSCEISFYFNNEKIGFHLVEDLNSCQILPFIDVNAHNGQVKFFVDFSLTKFKVKLNTKIF